MTFLIYKEPLVGQSVVTLENHVILGKSIPRRRLHVSVAKALYGFGCKGGEIEPIVPVCTYRFGFHVCLVEQPKHMR